MNALSLLEQFKGETILVSVLNWGLGHATRMMPFIDRLAADNEVIIGSDGVALSLLQSEYPELPWVELPSYGVRYEGRSLALSMLKQSPKFVATIGQEMALMEQLVDRYRLTVLLSDHRLGCFCEGTLSIFIGHQLRIQSSIKWGAMVVNRMQRYFINQFDRCWILDYEKRNWSLAGKMSESKGLYAPRYIGPVSRLRPAQLPIRYHLLVLLSGPEPARTRFQDQLLRLLSPLKWRILVVTGSNAALPIGSSEHIEIRRLTNRQSLNRWINESQLILARAGYSTIMDLVHMRKPAILVPTPGQPEQEYLAQYLSDYHDFSFLEEDALTTAAIETTWQAQRQSTTLTLDNGESSS